ncbi:hypothetical protein EDD53_1308 [Pacificibacter maritimus]|uniref:Uncharacterized protein n=1 Tax=Pacificibacter maritimus TaxID=762213 RepID=A0A3N4UP17_9RHOB|nr:hypothetical protein EDD53_1308 [Pacificibacter maritimus]
MTHNVLPDGLRQFSVTAKLRRHLVPKAVEDLALWTTVELGLNQLPEAIIDLTSEPRSLTGAKVGKEVRLRSVAVDLAGGVVIQAKLHQLWMQGQVAFGREQLEPAIGVRRDDQGGQAVHHRDLGGFEGRDFLAPCPRQRGDQRHPIEPVLHQPRSRLLQVGFALPAMPNGMGEEILHIIGGSLSS